MVKGEGRKAGSVHETAGKTDDHPETVVARGALNAEADSAPNGAGSEEGVDEAGPVAAGQATEPLPSSEPADTPGLDTTTGALQDDPMDDDNLTNMLRRISEP